MHADHSETSENNSHIARAWRRRPDAAKVGPMHHRSRSRLFLILAAVALGAASCSDNPLDTTSPNSPIAGEINTLFWGVMIIAGIVFVLVQGAVIYMGARFSVKGDPFDDEIVYTDEEFPEQIHGNDRLEVAWTILPALLLAVVGVFTLITLFQLDDVDAQPNARIDRIAVVGAQWWWEYHYYLDDGDDDEEVRLEVTSRDVIHSFWIPKLNGKRDAVPGRVSPWTLEADNPGRFLGQCTEFCGLSHAYMRMYAWAVPVAEWDEWAANQQTEAELPAEGTDAHAGYQSFMNNCASCHVVNGLTSVKSGEADQLDDWEMYHLSDRIIPDKAQQVSGAAPNLTHLMTRSSFAGSIYDLYEIPDDQVDLPDDYDYVGLAENGKVNRADLEAWIINAPEEKANAAEQEGYRRGMPAFTGLSSEEIDNIVTFLLTLD